MSITITTGELLDALSKAKAGAGNDDAQTIREMVASAGICRHTVMAALQSLAKEGRLQTHKVRRTGIDGVTRTLPGYTILPAKRRSR
jgi:hypothetical protein